METQCLLGRARGQRGSAPQQLIRAIRLRGATQRLSAKALSRLLAAWPGEGFARQRGESLIETMAAVGLFGLISTTFLLAISTSLMTSGQVQADYTSQNLARTQTEDIQNLAFADSYTYPVTVSAPQSYTVSIDVVDESPLEHPDTLQRIVVTVSRNGRRELTLESYKADLP